MQGGLGADERLVGDLGLALVEGNKAGVGECGLHDFDALAVFGSSQQLGERGTAGALCTFARCGEAEKAGAGDGLLSGPQCLESALSSGGNRPLHADAYARPASG